MQRNWKFICSMQTLRRRSIRKHKIYSFSTPSEILLCSKIAPRKPLSTYHLKSLINLLLLYWPIIIQCTFCFGAIKNWQNFTVGFRSNFVFLTWRVRTEQFINTIVTFIFFFIKEECLLHVLHTGTRPLQLILYVHILIYLCLDTWEIFLMNTDNVFDS